MSASMRPTRAPDRASDTARFTATVDLPTPPLPLDTAMTRPRFGRYTGVGAGGRDAAGFVSTTGSGRRGGFGKSVMSLSKRWDAPDNRAESEAGSYEPGSCRHAITLLSRAVGAVRERPLLP